MRLKRRLIMLIMLCCLLTGVFLVPASAESSASRVDYYATVNIDGDCMVTMSVNLHLEQADENLVFPLPVNAGNITMNGSGANTSRMGSYTAVYVSKVTGGSVGDFPVQFAFTLPKTVSVTENRKLKLELPILCGFSFPVDSLNYTVTLPNDVTGIPDFYSTYRQNGVASDLNNNISGKMITGSSKGGFNDHEALSVSMVVEPEMFPGVSVYVRTGNPELVPMGIFAGLALLYWLIFLRTWFPGKTRSTNPPPGVTAGELGCRLTLSGGDLTMMVFTWAQMGYLLIHLDGNNRVLLHKRMEMGNERSLFEVRTFQSLFGERRVIDGTGVQYAKLCRKTAAMIPGEKTMCKSSSGNTKIFRGILCISQVFCGICMAMNMTSILALQIFLSLILGVFGVVSAWQIQEIAYRTHLRGKTRVYIGLAAIVLWALIGLIAHQIWIPLGASAGQLLAGFLAAYGGRRSDLNKVESSQILGLRRYLKKPKKDDIQRLMSSDPDYFFRLAPYAMAMGVLKPFAAAFGKRKLEQCPYLVTRVHGNRKANDWAQLMVRAADMLDARARQMEMEKWMAIRFR